MPMHREVKYNIEDKLHGDTPVIETIYGLDSGQILRDQIDKILDLGHGSAEMHSIIKSKHLNEEGQYDMIEVTSNIILNRLYASFEVMEVQENDKQL